MNTTQEMTNQELLYIAWLSGEKRFLGIPDGFKSMETNEIKKEFTEIQHSLQEKNYADLDFDGKLSIRPEIGESVECCTNCRTAKF